jgi:nucleoside-diphosphate-sugar epimerase
VSSLVLVTGANGFVGSALTEALVEANVPTRCAFRSPAMVQQAPDRAERMVIGEIGPDTDWSAVVDGVDVVVHLAGRAHVMSDSAGDPLAEYRRVNVEGTAALAEAAVTAGVRRLVFVSSVKVHGEATDTVPFTEADPPAPSDPYAISKWEAEQVLHRLGIRTGLEVVVVRPTLVYGPEVKGNLYRLLRAIELGVPLPFLGIRNRRSLLYLGNLVDFLRVCMASPAIPGEAFLVADAEPVSTEELIRGLATGLGRPTRLVPAPSRLLRLVSRATGQGAAVDRLLDSLVVDTGKAQRVLNWTPPFTTKHGLRETARWGRSRHDRTAL